MSFSFFGQVEKYFLHLNKKIHIGLGYVCNWDVCSKKEEHKKKSDHLQLLFISYIVNDDYILFHWPIFAVN